MTAPTTRATERGMTAEEHRAKAELARRFRPWHVAEADQMEAASETSSWRTRRIANHRQIAREYDREAAEHDAIADAIDRADQ